MYDGRKNGVLLSRYMITQDAISKALHLRDTFTVIHEYVTLPAYLAVFVL